MWKYNCEKRNKYYDEVIRLYTFLGIKAYYLIIILVSFLTIVFPHNY